MGRSVGNRKCDRSHHSSWRTPRTNSQPRSRPRFLNSSHAAISCSRIDLFYSRCLFCPVFCFHIYQRFAVSISRFGPMIDLKGIGLMLSIFKGRAVVYLIVLAAQLTFLMTLAVNLHLG